MKKTKLAVTGLAISISLLSVTAVATAKASIGLIHPTENQYQTYSSKVEEDLFVMDTKFRVTMASQLIKPNVQTVPQEIPRPPLIKKESPKLQSISVPANVKKSSNQTKMKSAMKAPKQSAPKEITLKKTTIRKTKADNKIHTLQVPSGNDIQYSRLIPVKATAYTAAAEENGLWGAYDYYGDPLKLGTIAVDPDIIPMGSTVYITGYSFDGLPSKGMIAKATDMGSAVKGKRVDIFVPTSRADASKFGMQDVKVYILE
jgi:3D (Asp-Asp-Asp) domain-containing protein